jgi:hypothetical protein
MATYAEPRTGALLSAALISSITRRLPVIGILALQALVSVVALRNTAYTRSSAASSIWLADLSLRAISASCACWA